MTKFDGWFLKFFPYDNEGKTPAKVTISQTMLPETVVVPFKYQVVISDGVVLEETPLELVAGIVGVTEDPDDFTMTPKVGWFVRTVKVSTQTQEVLLPLCRPSASGLLHVDRQNSYNSDFLSMRQGKSSYIYIDKS